MVVFFEIEFIISNVSIWSFHAIHKQRISFNYTYIDQIIWFEIEL